MKYLACTALAIGAMASTQVIAANSSRIGLGPVTIELVDLDPADGIAPSFAFTSFVGSSIDQFQAVASQSDTGAWDADSFSPAGIPWSPRSTSASAGVASSAVFFEGLHAPNGSVVSAVGFADDFSSAVPSEGRYSSYASVNLFHFTLTPKTQVTFSAATTASIYAKALNAGNRDGVEVNASLVAEGFTSGTLHVLSAGDSYRDDQWTHPDGLAHRRTRTQILSVTLENPYGETFAGYARGVTSAMGSTFINQTPIPEPGTYAMLLAGLAAVGVAVRRRRH